MRGTRSLFLQQRLLYTEARQGQQALGENRDSVSAKKTSAGKQLLGPERFNLSTENT